MPSYPCCALYWPTRAHSVSFPDSRYAATQSSKGTVDIINNQCKFGVGFLQIFHRHPYITAQLKYAVPMPEAVSDHARFTLSFASPPLQSWQLI